MSWFMGILRFIFGEKEEDRSDRSHTYARQRNSNQRADSFETFLPRSMPTSVKESKPTLGPGLYASLGTKVSKNTRNVERYLEVPRPAAKIPSPKPTRLPPVSATSSSRPSSASWSSSGLPSSSTNILPSLKQNTSPAPSNSANQQTKANYARVEERAASLYKTPRDIENNIKNDIVPSGLPSSSVNSLPRFKPTLFPASSTSADQQAKANYVWVEKAAPSIYKIPSNIEDMIKNDSVPGVLLEPLSPSTYMDYFAALLYAEDYYIEKWSNFLLKNAALKIEEASVHKNGQKEEKSFVAFQIERVPEKRPFLMSRDFVFAKPVGRKEPFQGVIYRIVKSTKVLVEFGDDFHHQHYPGQMYDISFSFNRVCLKRAHQAIAAASDPSFHGILFPSLASSNRVCIPPPIPYVNYRLNLNQMSAVKQILNLKGSPPYLVEGPLCVNRYRAIVLSETGRVVKEATLELYRRSQEAKILICAPINSTLDFLLRSLNEGIPDSEMFRANAAFRGRDFVPDDILSSCLYNDDSECFFCPSLQELKGYTVILATFVSAFRLHHEGIHAGHFSHIFLVDASSAPEPEVMIALANLANESTSVVVLGEHGNHPAWIRSDIARKNGLKVSYFERLCKTYQYKLHDPDFISEIKKNAIDDYRY